MRGRIVILLIALIATVAWIHSTRTQDHHVRVAFESAGSIFPGLDVQLDGMDVGKVADVRYEDGEAIVTLGIDDSRAWPLRRGTRAEIRFGSTIGSGTRRIDLLPGPAGSPALPEGAIIAARDSTSPVEFDDFFNTFSAGTRRHLRRLAERGAVILRDRGAALNRGLQSTPPTLDALEGVLADLAADGSMLRRLVPATTSVVDTLSERSDRVSSLVLVASQTFEAFAARSTDVQRSLSRLPGTLRGTRSTLGRLRGSADELRALLREVGPGIRRLSALAPELSSALREVRRTVPLAERTVETTIRSAPPLRDLLRVATPLMSRDLQPALAELAPMLQCLAPYAPEVAAWVSTWAGFSKNYDANGHYARFHVRFGPFTGIQGLTPAQFAATSGIDYARFRPPGQPAGESRLLSQCGYGSWLFDPASSPEDAR